MTLFLEEILDAGCSFGAAVVFGLCGHVGLDLLNSSGQMTHVLVALLPNDHTVFDTNLKKD